MNQNNPFKSCKTFMDISGVVNIPFITIRRISNFLKILLMVLVNFQRSINKNISKIPSSKNGLLMAFSYSFLSVDFLYGNLTQYISLFMSDVCFLNIF